MTDDTSVSSPSSPKVRPLWADILLTVLRVVLGGLFVTAAFVKLTAPVEQFEAAIRTFEVMPSETLVHVTATVWPWIELIFGTLLIFGVFIKLALWAHIFQISLYIVLISQGILRGLDIECGCFGKGLPTTPSQALWRDIAMLLIAFVLLRWLPTRWGVDGMKTSSGKRLPKHNDA